MAAPLVKGRAQLRRKGAGLLFLLVLVGAVWLATALYQKAFTPVVLVDLHTDRIGNQMSKGADVKMRGLLVGEVREVSSSGEGATLRLALQKDRARDVPANVSAQLLPKTLFGEKFVALESPTAGPARPLRTGDVIAQDRTSTARETAKAVDDLLPLLQTLEPRQLSTTLNALSGALRGRGDRLGNNFVLTDNYLRQLNPELPTIEQDFRGIADLGDNVDAALPDLLRVLGNSSFSSRSLVDQQTQLAAFLRTTSGFNASAESTTRENSQRFIDLARDSLPSLLAYARYSPEFPCLLTSLGKQEIAGEHTFGGDQPGLHIVIEVNKNQGPYLPGDQPRLGEDRGPTCFGLTGKPVVPFPPQYEPHDGYCDAQEQRSRGVDTGNCHPKPPPGAGGGQGVSAQAMRDPLLSLAPTAHDRAAVGTVAGPVLGVPPDEVPDIAMLLFGPVARGTTVSLG